MSVQIPTQFVDMYSGNLETLLRQSGSVLRPYVQEQRIKGKQAFFDQIGGVVARDKVGRHSDVVYNDTPHARRQVTTVSKYAADLIDREDLIRILQDPTSEYLKSQSDALGLAIDQVVIAAATGTAYTGVTGATATSYDTNNTVAVTVAEPGVSAGNYGLNVAKLRKAARIMDQNFVPATERILVWNARQKESLLATTKATSGDYNTVRALVDGSLDSFMGFKFVLSQYIGTDGSGYDKVLFFHRTGIKLALGMDLTVNVDPIPTKFNAMQLLSEIDVGATRMQEGKVGYIECHTTAGPGA